MSGRERRAAALVFATLALSYAWFFQGGGYNPNARLAQARAIAERGVLHIDAYPHTGDWAEHAGHRYPNKAPALSLLAAPLWWALGDAAPGEALSRPAWLVNLALNALPAALLGLVLFHTLPRLGTSDPALRAGAVLCYGLGTLAFPYATALYAHQPAACAGFASFALLLAAEGSRRRAAAAGALAGLAVTLELSAALGVLVVLAWLVTSAERRGLCAAFVVGGLPFALALAAYDAAAFGSPFTFWFLHANPEVEVRVDGGLFGLPRPMALIELLLLPYRGLLPTSPVLLLALLAWPALRRAAPAAAWVCAAVPLLFVALLASFHARYGGWAPGPRYLVPALPFLVPALAQAVARWPRATAALGAASAACMLAFAATSVEVPAGFANPLLDFALPQLAAGRVSVNPQPLDALLPPEGYAHGGGPDNAAAFNAGELLGLSGLASLLPLLAVWLIAAAALVRLREPPGADGADGAV